MKNLLITLSLFLTSIYLAGQSQSIEWQKCLGGTLADQGYSIRQTTDGGYIVTGRSTSNDGDVNGNHGGYDCWVVKLSSVGAIEWQKSLGGTGDDVGFSIEQTTDGGYIVAGQSTSIDGDVSGNHGGDDYWVVKLNSLGTIEWQECFGGSGLDMACSIEQTTDGGYIVAGSSFSIDGDVTDHYGDSATSDYWIIKLSNNGAIEWQKSLGGAYNENASSIHQTTDGGYIVAGQSIFIDGDITSNHGGDDYWVVKLDSIGTIEWQKSFGGGSNDIAHSIQQTTDGGYVVSGSSYSINGDVTNHHGTVVFSDYWLVKLDDIGNIEWQKSLGGTNQDYGGPIQQTTDGGYIVFGSSNSSDGDVTSNHSGINYWVVKLNNTGVIIWQKSLGGTGSDYGQSIQQTFDGSYIVAGSSTSNNFDVTNNHGFFDYWVVKLSLTVDVNEIIELNDFSVYPNPTSNQITLKANTNLLGTFYNIYDSMGKTVLSGQINAAQTVIELGNLSGGIYLFSVGESKQSFKVIKN